MKKLMNGLHRQRKMTCFGLFLLVGFLGANTACLAGGEVANPYNSPQQKQAFDARARKFGTLWLNRNQRRISPELLQMLNAEPTVQLRERIVIALGRLEDPASAPSLRKLLTVAEAEARNPVSAPQRDKIAPFRIRLALGRIGAKNLRGLAKLNQISRSLGTNWTGIQKMAAQTKTKLHNKRTRRQAQNSQDRFIVEEFYDVIYKMGKQGQPIQSFGADNLKIWDEDPSQMPDALYSHSQALMQAARLSETEEVKFWLNRAAPPNRTLFDPAHLLDLGPTVKPELMRALKLTLAIAKANPKALPMTVPQRAMFSAAAATGDRQFLPILKQFKTVDDQGTKVFATYSVQQLTQGAEAIPFP